MFKYCFGNRIMSILVCKQCHVLHVCNQWIFFYVFMCGEGRLYILIYSIVWHRLDYVESVGACKVRRMLIRILFYIDFGKVCACHGLPQKWKTMVRILNLVSHLQKLWLLLIAGITQIYFYYLIWVYVTLTHRLK